MPKKLLLFLIICFLALPAKSQINNSHIYPDDFSLLNPAYIGMLETNRITVHTIETNLSNYYPSVSIGRVAISIPVSKIHSSFGLHSNYGKNGFISSSEFGMLYSFSYDIADDIKVSLGTNFTIDRTKITGNDFFDGEDVISISGDDIPVYDGKATYLLNLDAGLWIRVYGFQLGLCMDNINRPSLDSTIVIDPGMNLVLNHEMLIAGKHTMSNSLHVFDLMSFSRWKYFVMNNRLKINNTLIIGVTTDLHFSDEIYGAIAPNIGMNLSNTFDLVLSFNMIKINPMGFENNTIEAMLNYNF